MSLEAISKNIQRSVPECVACGVIDMNTGMLLSVRTVDSHPQEVLDMLAAATGDLFQGENVTTIVTPVASAPRSWRVPIMPFSIWG